MVCGVVIVSYEVLRVILPCEKKEKLKTGISEQPGEFLMLLLKLSKKDWSFEYGSKFSHVYGSLRLCSWMSWCSVYDSEVFPFAKVVHMELELWKLLSWELDL